MTVRRMIAALLAGGLLLTGCGTSANGNEGADHDPELVANLQPGDAQAVGEAVNGFGFDLLGEVTDGSGNAVTSPLSVSVMLAMVLAGAGGDTADAMADALHLDDARDVRVGALLEQLTGATSVDLKVANALWSNEGTPFETDYLEFLRDTFQATAQEADLGDAATAEEIDAWVDEHTEGLIDGIAEDLGLPDPSAIMVLINAVYFLGEWTTQFEPGDTIDRPFTLAGGEQADVPLMHLRGEELDYTERDGYRMLRLPYGEAERFGMEVLLPDEGTDLGNVLDSLDAGEWRTAVDSLQEQTVAELALPRFELEWDAQLNDALAALGMDPVFGQGADLRPMSPANPSLDAVVHKTYIQVDEEGTEAAAVTGGVGVTSAPADELVFRVDRPFAFTISDQETGTVLFLGAVADPRG